MKDNPKYCSHGSLLTHSVQHRFSIRIDATFDYSTLFGSSTDTDRLTTQRPLIRDNSYLPAIS